MDHPGRAAEQRQQQQGLQRSVRENAAGDGAVISPREHNGNPFQKVVKNRSCAGALSDGERLSDVMEE